MAAPSPRKPWWRRWFGTRSERAAARYLRGLGWRILCRNYSTPRGELDLVVLDDRTVVFVEVRSTETGNEQQLAASVDLAKQTHLTEAALTFLQAHNLLGQTARFDVLLVTWPAGSRTPVITHHRQAFESVGRYQMFS